MRKISKLKKYIELFKRGIDRYLAEGVVIKATAYPVIGEGAVFEFVLNDAKDDAVKIEIVRPSVGNVLSQIPQRLVGGNVGGIRFGGTSLYLEGNRILIVKGEDSSSSWSGEAVLEDVQRVVSTSQGGKTA